MFLRPVRTFSRFSSTSSIPSSKQNERRESSDLNSERSMSPIKRPLNVIQLTPLWEFIIRTRRLPDDLNVGEVFDEFQERLRDPEWQVRQHALRVLVDLLLVMGDEADVYFGPLIPPLIENLGHDAPAIRKASLDALRIYIANTLMPETVMLEILDTGLERQAATLAGARYTIGVILSIPSLIQPVLLTPKRSFILRSVFNVLEKKMLQIQYQEIVLKVLLKIKEMIGEREFNGSLPVLMKRDFELLCKVYNFPPEEKPKAWTKPEPNNNTNLPCGNETSKPSNKEVPFNVLPDNKSFQRIYSPEADDDGASFVKIDSESDAGGNTPEPQKFDFNVSDNAVTITDRHSKRSFSARSTPRPMEVRQQRPLSHTTTSNLVDEHGKVIMETEIKLSKDTAVMMRIFETPAENQDEDVEFELDIDGLDESTHKEVNVNIIKPADDDGDETDTDSLRTPKRVTFGGEVVKMRTPDSDTNNSDNAVSTASSTQETAFNEMVSERLLQTSTEKQAMEPLHIKIPDQPTIITVPPSSSDSPSPRISRRNSTSILDRTYVGGAREVQMMHNLTRSPTMSPTKSTTPAILSPVRYSPVHLPSHGIDNNSTDNTDSSTPENQNVSWETLGIVSQSALRNLRSGDYRLRAQGYTKLESALKSFETLAQVQPYLPSLLKTLLSFETHQEIIEQKQRIVTNLISRLPLENLENNFGRIMTGLCRQGGAGSNLVAKAMMHRLPTAAIVLRLLSEEFLHDRTSKFKENALQMVMFALITFPSTYFDVQTCVHRASQLALDRKKRVRQASLDVLAILGQISSSSRVVLDATAESVKYKIDGDTFLAAVKARLSRKVLPHVSSDGTVEYALKLPKSRWQHAANSFGADIDWICEGSGSVSPPSVRGRRDDLMYTAIHSKHSRSFPELNRTAIIQAERIKRTKLPVTTRFPDVHEPRIYGNPYATYPKKIKALRSTESFSIESSTSSNNEFTPTADNTSSSKKYEQSTNRQLKGILVKSGTDPTTQTPEQTKSTAPEGTGYESEVSSMLGENQQDDSDDSTATRIIEKSNLFHRPKSASHESRSEPSALPEVSQTETTTESEAAAKDCEQTDEVDTKTEPDSEQTEETVEEMKTDEVRVTLSHERPKTCIVTHENETIVITRPKTTGTINEYERREFKLTLEIEPVDQITIRTPPKTPERVSLTFDVNESVLVTRSEAIPLPPPPSQSPPPPPPVPEERVGSPSTRSPTRSPTPTTPKAPLSFEEIPIAVQKMEVTPMVPHFNTPQPLQTTDSTYESTTDTEQKKPVAVSSKTKKKEKASGKKPERPRELIVNCFLKLQSPNWEEVMEGIESFVFLIKHHADLVDANLHLMAIELSKQIKNLRSQVARAACQAAGELFQTHRRTIEPEAEELTAMLLNRTSDTNKFLRADAIRALECMCENLPVAKVIHLLAIKGAMHHNGLVKCATAKLLSKHVERLGGEKVFTLSRETRDKLILTSANLLTEGSLETRSYAKEIFRRLATGHPNAAKIFHDVIPPRVYRNIEKTLKNLLIF